MQSTLLQTAPFYFTLHQVMGKHRYNSRDVPENMQWDTWLHIWLSLSDCSRVVSPSALADLAWLWQGQSSVSAVNPGVFRGIGYDFSLWRPSHQAVAYIQVSVLRMPQGSCLTSTSFPEGHRSCIGSLSSTHGCLTSSRTAQVALGTNMPASESNPSFYS